MKRKVKMTRRDFVRGCAAATFGLTPRWLVQAVESPEVGGTLPGWKSGELELHFIYTGCGENCFYRLPDGTSILNDVGDFYRPRDLAHIPLLPSGDRLGGEWVSRYIQRVYNEKTIDYLILSHWHEDHTGAIVAGRKSTSDAMFRDRTFADGTKGSGVLCVAQDFAFRRYFDHQYPEFGAYKSEGKPSVELIRPWLAEQVKKGLFAEPFRVGALNQITMLRNPAKYKDAFSVRNLCTNGRAWDGADGECDYAAEHVKATGNEVVSQNLLSLAFVMRYGKFSYFAGGDVSGVLRRISGDTVDYEEIIGRLAGKVTVCKANHHGCSDAMSEGFVRAVRADAYVSCIWCPGQLDELTLSRMASCEIHHGSAPILVPNIYPAVRWKRHESQSFIANVPVETRTGVHVVIKVAPGGETYKIYLVDARDEAMRVCACLERVA